MAPMLATLRREAEALSQGRHAISVEDTRRRGPARLDQGTAQRLLEPGQQRGALHAGRRPHHDPLRAPNRRRRGAGRCSDTGYGIPAAHLPRITERFYRVSTSRSRESGGTGLGLSIVKHVLNLHQARLEIESEVGRGSTFSCHFGADRVRARDDPCDIVPPMKPLTP